MSTGATATEIAVSPKRIFVAAKSISVRRCVSGSRECQLELRPNAFPSRRSTLVTGMPIGASAMEIGASPIEIAAVQNEHFRSPMGIRASPMAIGESAKEIGASPIGISVRRWRWARRQ